MRGEHLKIKWSVIIKKFGNPNVKEDFHDMIERLYHECGSGKGGKVICPKD